jgi:hypothetical protein
LPLSLWFLFAWSARDGAAVDAFTTRFSVFSEEGVVQLCVARAAEPASDRQANAHKKIAHANQQECRPRLSFDSLFADQQR